jgi:NAD(P)-dependent dehydrogenase (short-subunit alcohol dehydrogenase family)
MNPDNKVSLVTGGANGIGRCIAEAFLDAGARVAVVDTDAVSGRQLVKRFPGRLLFVHGDISEETVIDDFATQAVAAFGKVDCLVNNACVSRRGILSGCSFDDFNYVLRLGVTAPYCLAKRLRGHFAKGAAIVNISSTRAVMSQPDTESYTAAKGGISALTHALSVSLAGVARVNSISPGWIDTGAYQHDDAYRPKHAVADQVQHTAGRIGVPEDIARTVLFLCSDDAAFINGQNITVDGGMSKLMIYHGDGGWTYDRGKHSE